VNPLLLIALGTMAAALATAGNPGPRTVRPRRAGSPVNKWTENPGVVQTEATTAFLKRLVARTTVPVHVTSGARTPRAQAKAMIAKYLDPKGGLTELLELYPDDVVSRLMAVPATVDAWTEQIEAIRSTGAYFTGGHMGERGALDLRTNGLTSDQVAQLVSDCEAEGGSTLLEDAPPHLHVGMPT
jgi:hypothetical protein